MGSGTAVLFLIIFFVFALYEGKNENIELRSTMLPRAKNRLSGQL